MFSADFKQQLDKITAKYEQKQAALLPVLHYVQEKDGFITPEAEQNISEYLGVPVVHIHEVVSFYHLFHQSKKGKCHFSVCQTTACALRGAEEVIAYIKEKTGLKAGETTADGKFSLTVVECLGACEFAPAMQHNKEYVSCVTKEKIDQLMNNHPTSGKW